MQCTTSLSFSLTLYPVVGVQFHSHPNQQIPLLCPDQWASQQHQGIPHPLLAHQVHYMMC